jgi:hypothetical protein
MLESTVLDKTLEGYKGGDYRMTAETPVWIGDYSYADGVALVGVELRSKPGEAPIVVLVDNYIRSKDEL